MKGIDTTLGYVGRAFAPAAEDAVVVQALKGLGAVVIAKTNVPQSIMVCLASKVLVLLLIGLVGRDR